MVLGMLGVRVALVVRHPAVFGLSLAAWAVVTAWYLIGFWNPATASHHQTAAVVFAVFAWLFYYVGNTVVLGSRIRTWLIERYGEDRALAAFNGVMGVAFACQAYAHGAINTAFTGTMSVKLPWVWVVVGAVILGIGLLVKVWATAVTSLDTYYYNDMFIGRPVKACPEYVARGPYRVFRNPMYGVGNLSAYGAAAMALSWQGLVLALVFQASIFGFHYLVERPFVQRVYVRKSGGGED